MFKRRKKVIIITTILIISLFTLIFFLDFKTKQTSDNSDLQDVATNNITLPNGGKIQVAGIQAVHGKIGANLSELTPGIKQNLHFADHVGVYVQDTLRNSPAQTAGILPGDIITQINNTEIAEIYTTIKLIASLKRGNSYPFTVFRQGQYLEYTITIT